MGQPFGTVAVPLAKAKFALDEDGVIYVRKRLSARLAMKFAGKDVALDDLLPLIIAGWSIKADGIELVYSEATATELPVEMLEAINEHIANPLVDSMRSMNRRSQGSASQPQSDVPADANLSTTTQ